MSKPKFSLRELGRNAIGPYRDLYPFLKPYRVQFTLALVFGTLFCAATGLFPFLLLSTFDFLNSYLMAWVSLRVLTDMRSKLYQHILSQSLEFFNRERAGNLMSRVINDTRQAQTALTGVSSDLIKQPITIVGSMFALLYLDWKFTIGSLVLFPVCLVPILLFGKRVKKQGQLEEQKVGIMMTALQETFSGIRVIKAFAH